MFRLRECPSCKQKSLMDLPIGITPTQVNPGNVYQNSVCYNKECNYRDLKFLEKIYSEKG